MEDGVRPARECAGRREEDQRRRGVSTLGKAFGSVSG
jgi:hypothetical protein